MRCGRDPNRGTCRHGGACPQLGKGVLCQGKGPDGPFQRALAPRSWPDSGSWEVSQRSTRLSQPLLCWRTKGFQAHFASPAQVPSPRKDCCRLQNIRQPKPNAWCPMILATRGLAGFLKQCPVLTSHLANKLLKKVIRPAISPSFQPSPGSRRHDAFLRPHPHNACAVGTCHCAECRELRQ